MSLENSLKLVPGNVSILRQGGSAMTPPNACRPLQLVGCILSFHWLSQPQQTKLLFKCVQPFLCLEWFFSLLENRGLGIQEILEITILVWLCTLALMSALGNLLRHGAHSLAHSTLHFSEHNHQLCRSGWGWWWQIFIVITMQATTPGTIIPTCSRTCARHLQNCNNKQLLRISENCRRIV